MFFGHLVTPQSYKTSSTKVEAERKFLNLKKDLEKAYDANSSKEISLSHYKLGIYYEEATLYFEAIEQYNKSLAHTSPKDTLTVILKNQIASIHLNHKNYSNARQHLFDAIEIAERLKYSRGLALSEGIIGSCYEKEGDYLKALEHQEKSATIFRRLGDQRGIALVNENIGSIYEDLEQFDKALYYFEKSFSYLKNYENKLQISILNNLGDIYRKTGNYSEAEKFTTKALTLAEKLNDLSELESAHKDLSEIYFETGEYKKAYTHFNEYDEILNDLLFSENLKQLNTLQTIHYTKEQEAQISKLTRQNQINEANQNLLLVGMGAILLFSGVFYYTLQKKRKTRSEVQNYEQQLLKAQLSTKAIEEKKLNDEIHFKTASLSKYSLNIAQKNKLISDLSETLKNIAARPKMDAQLKIKSLIHDLDSNLEQAEEWDEFMGYFKEIHPQFFKRLNTISNGKLTPTEYRLAMLLRLKMSSKEIASILRITPDSVRVARYRFRKKLPIDSVKLSQFLQEL